MSPENLSTDERMWDELSSYDYSGLGDTLGTKGTDNLYVGNPVSVDEFYRSGLNVGTMDSINEAFDRKGKRVVVLSGAPRMGKSSLGKAWVSSFGSDQGVYIDMHQPVNDQDLSRYLKGRTHVFVDEASGGGNTENALRRILSEDNRRVLLSTNLVDFPELVRFVEQELGPGAVHRELIPLKSVEEMVTYVSEVVGLPRNDGLITMLARISGGCPYVLSRLLTILEQDILWVMIDDEGEVDNSRVPGNLIALALDRMGDTLARWDRMRETVDTEMKPYIPNPLLSALQRFVS